LENLVWYANIDDKELKDILVDSEGNPHTFSLGVGHISPEVKEKKRNCSSHPSSPYGRALAKGRISIHTGHHGLSGEMYVYGWESHACWRCCRWTQNPYYSRNQPSSVAKALLLKRVFEKGSAMSVVEWEQKILEWSTTAHAVGIKLGNLSQFGEHPMAEKDEGPKI
jgi:hypothetical protein